MRKRNPLGGLADDFDVVTGATKIEDAPPAETPKATPPSPVEVREAEEPTPEPSKAQERPKRAAKPEKAPTADLAADLAKLQESVAPEYLNTRVPTWLDERVDEAFRAEARRRKALDAAAGRRHAPLRKQLYVGELLLRGLAHEKENAQE